MKDFDMEIYLSESSWLKASQMGGSFLARHRCSLEDKKEIGEILISLGNQILKDYEDKKDVTK